MKIVFMGTPDFAVEPLEAILAAGYQVELVVSQPDKPKGRGKKLQPTPVKAAAEKHGIEVYQPIKLNTAEAYDKIKAIEPDLIIVVAYGQILRENILQLPRLGCYNIHASLLPKYRGAAPIQWAIINGDRETGITIMKMERGLDSGDMLLKRQVAILPDMNAEELHDNLCIEGGKAIVEALDILENKAYTLTPQNHDLFTYAPMLDKELGRIQWQNNVETIHNLIRGVYPWPGAFTLYKGQNMKVLKARIEDKSYGKPCGTICEVNKNGIWVQAQDSCIVIEMIQFPGKKAMFVRDYLAGNELENNIVLGE